VAVKTTNDAHNVALEWLKQIITLSSGIIVLSATFIGSIFKKLNWSVSLLVLSWVLFVLAIVFALETMSVITQSRISGNQEWIKGRGRNYARDAKRLFIAAVSVFMVFTLINFFISASRGA
jgi:hypothetical protein